MFYLTDTGIRIRLFRTREQYVSTRAHQPGIPKSKLLELRTDSEWALGGRTNINTQKQIRLKEGPLVSSIHGETKHVHGSAWEPSPLRGQQYERKMERIYVNHVSLHTLAHNVGGWMPYSKNTARPVHVLDQYASNMASLNGHQSGQDTFL